MSPMLIDVFEPVDEFDRRLARDATGLVGDLNRAGVLTAADVHVARALARAAGGVEEASLDAALTAAALATRAVRTGSIAVDLDDVDAALRDLATLRDYGVSLPWANADEWREKLADSSLVRKGALVIDRGLLYLQRYHHQEVEVVTRLRERAAQPPPVVDEAVVAAGLARIFPPGWEEQGAAARTLIGSWTSVLTGGPGTGKTSTVAGVLALLAEQAGTDRPLRVGLAAPTGKAAARMKQAVAEALHGILDRVIDPHARAAIEPLHDVDAVTLHRLLGYRPGSSTRFRHDRDNLLPHDVVLIDETSMVSLTHMARLLEALRPTTRLILVGDADQLVSVDAGAVLADLVAGTEAAVEAGGDRIVSVARLRTSHRFGPRIGGLAQALRDGDADRVVALLGGTGATDGPGADGEVSWVDAADPTAYLQPILTRHALGVYRAAMAGDGLAALSLLGEHRLLCGHREGPFGVATWNRHVERWLRDETGDGLHDPMYIGRPLLVTANDYPTGVFNGDTGVVVRTLDDGDGMGRVALIRGSAGDQPFGPDRLGDVETMHAMTIHKAQGSQAKEITVVMPDVDSPLLTRELFYTAVTRAVERVRIVGTEAAIRAAVERRVLRASGLTRRLQG